MYGNGMLGRTLREVNPKWERVLEPFEVAEGEVLATPDRLSRTAFLVDAGVLSVRPVSGDVEGAAILLGEGGLTTPHALLGSDPLPLKVACELPAKGYAVSTQAARALVAQCPTSRRVIERFQHEVIADLAQMCLAATALDVPQRLAIWLLQASEAVGQGVIPMSHARVAGLMGINRRASITEALAVYADEKAIMKGHGSIIFLNEGLLIRRAGRIVLEWKARRTALSAFLERTYSEAVLAA